MEEVLAFFDQQDIVCIWNVSTALYTEVLRVGQSQDVNPRLLLDHL